MGGVEQSDMQGAGVQALSPLGLGLRLVHEREKGASRCVSPVSLMMALDMAREGAVGATRSELDTFLSSPYVEANRTLGLVVNGDGALRVANAIWIDEGLRPSATFIDTLRKQHGALAKALPLRSEPSKSAAQINGWVKENTKGLIEKLVEAADVAQASMVLTNALYFMGHWEHPFKKEDTETRRFNSFHSAYDVPMMHQERMFRYAEDSQLQVLEMPYKESDYRLLVVLPRVGAKETEWEAIDARRIKTLYDSLEYAQVNVAFPRFDSKVTLRLVPSLHRLGLKQSLSSAADFSGMGEGFGGEQIGEVIQAVRFTVDEEKTEAAAATGVVMMRACLPPQAVDFIADHPFIYIVYSETVENAVFVGVLED